jgi:signal peptidase I
MRALYNIGITCVSFLPHFWKFLKLRSLRLLPFLVSGSSMVPNFQNGDYVLVDEFTYRISSPSRGDAVVFHDPQDWSTYFIKRVIGLPGEKVQINNNDITVFSATNPNGLVLKESYLPAGIAVSANNCFGGSFQASICTYTLSSSTYLTLGDNRPESYDSRSWGPLPVKNIVGLVRIRLWPLNEISIFTDPKY